MKLVDLTVSHYPECQSTVVGRQNVTEEEAAEWFDEFAELEENGAYFFSVTPVLTEAVKIAWNFATTRPRRACAMRAGQLADGPRATAFPNAGIAGGIS